MLNTQKLLYILPDLAYIAEVLPDKKPHTFVVQSFKQLNGDLLSEENFIPGSVIKLFSKLDPDGEYHIILPDFLFTTTIVSINEKSEAKIQDELKNTTLPKMGLHTDSHLIVTAVLNEIRGVSRVQISAIEKEILAPLRVGASEHKIKIAGISPLSWAIKSMVSLEPSITVLQMGSNLYASEHYIGVDQPSVASVDNPEIIIETIKTLKGSEPSIQTVYLLGNALVEEKLKTALTKTLPIQQMATSTSETDKMPSYIKQIVEYSMKTLSISDFPVPVFALSKPSAEEIVQYQDAIAADINTNDDDDQEVTLPKPATPILPMVAPVVTPTIIPPISAPDDEDDDLNDDEEIQEEKALAVEPETLKSEESSTAVPALAVAATTAALGGSSPVLAENEVPLKAESIGDSMNKPAKAEIQEDEIISNEDIDLSQFVQAQSAVEPAVIKKEEKPIVIASPTIKNKSGVQSMLKMIFITLAVFCVTVAVGVGVGLAILKFSGSNDTASNPEVKVESTPEPTATPVAEATASPSASPATTAQIANYKVLIVNATKKAGYAGTFKTKIEAAKLGKVTAGNAKGTYTEGFSISLKNQNPALLKQYSDATDLELTENNKVATTEDPQGTYDVVIVLAE